MKFLKKLIIAIDGESSSGKSSLARELARNIGYKHINTGSMYRAVTYYAIKNGFINKNKTNEFNHYEILEMVNNMKFEFQLVNNNSEIFINNKNIQSEINSPEVSDFVSQISTISALRTIIVNIQRNIGINKGIVMEGRDIGSVVFPAADLKFFITADIKTRTKRRFIELNQKGIKIKEKQVGLNLRKRDFLDKNRENSPLIQSPEAIKIDNTNLSIDEQILIINSHIKKKLKKK
ncbi:MAG: cytidylate kinase [Flavobacteriales bacterium]|nr:cytidylate kinase [Flavobacteriales bacterium]